MKIHEYQTRMLFSRYGIPTNAGRVCTNVDEIVDAYKKYGPVVVIKAQVYIGGRGKLGGVKLAYSKDEAINVGQQILMMNINRHHVEKVFVASAAEIAKEYYIGFVNDRNAKSVVLMTSKEGGIEIEEVAKRSPELIQKFVIHSDVGLPAYLARKIAFSLFDNMDQVRQGAEIIQKLYRLYVDTDATLAEINPLVITPQNKLLAIDGKMNFDDNAYYRQKEIFEMREVTPDEQKELDAKNKGFSYVRLDGNIGCMVNGAGLAMATMDMIKLYGAEPANFLDIGGSSNPAKVMEAMKLLISDKNVAVVLINIFGGITRCDDVALGLIQAFEVLKTDIPIVVRLTGTNEQQGRAMLKNTHFYIEETMSEAARTAIKLSGISDLKP